MKTKHRHLSGQLASTCQLSAWKYINSSRNRKEYLSRGVTLSNCMTAHHWPFPAKPIAALTLQLVRPWWSQQWGQGFTLSPLLAALLPHFTGSLPSGADNMELSLFRPATSLGSPDNAGTCYPELASKPGNSLWFWRIIGLPCVVSPLPLWFYSVCSWMVRYLGNSYTEYWSLLQKFWSLSSKSNKKDSFTKRLLNSYSEFLPKSERTSTAMQNCKIYIPDFPFSVFGRFELGLDSFDNQAGSP